jgi:hypothetical protein
MGVAMLSGCVNVDQPPQVPVVTVKPTNPPTVTPVPTPVIQEKSTDVKILPFADNGITDFSYVKDTDIQRENITVILRNDGVNEAKNVHLLLTETDGHTGDLLKQQNFLVGDLPRGEYKEFSMQTDDHQLAESVYMTISIQWGESDEFSSPMTYVNLAKSTLY